MAGGVLSITIHIVLHLKHRDSLLWHIVSDECVQLVIDRVIVRESTGSVVLRVDHFGRSTDFHPRSEGVDKLVAR